MASGSLVDWRRVWAVAMSEISIIVGFIVFVGGIALGLLIAVLYYE